MTWLKSIIAPFLAQILGVLALFFFAWAGYASWQVNGLKASNARLIKSLNDANYALTLEKGNTAELQKKLNLQNAKLLEVSQKSIAAINAVNIELDKAKIESGRIAAKIETLNQPLKGATICERAKYADDKFLETLK